MFSILPVSTEQAGKQLCSQFYHNSKESETLGMLWHPKGNEKQNKTPPLTQGGGKRTAGTPRRSHTNPGPTFAFSSAVMNLPRVETAAPLSRLICKQFKNPATRSVIINNARAQTPRAHTDPDRWFKPRCGTKRPGAMNRAVRDWLVSATGQWLCHRNSARGVLPDTPTNY